LSEDKKRGLNRQICMENLVFGMVFCTHSKETDKKVRGKCFYNFVLLTRLEIYGNHHLKKTCMCSRAS